MTTQVTLAYEKFSVISGIEFEGVCKVSVSLGCASFAKRDIYDPGFPVHLSLETPDGKFLGNGAYSGVVTAFSEDVLEELWQSSNERLDEDELYLSAGANEGDYLDEDGSPICSDCLVAAGEFDEETTPVNPEKGCVCWSCKTMVEESMWAKAQEREWSGIL